MSSAITLQRCACGVTSITARRHVLGGSCSFSTEEGVRKKSQKVKKKEKRASGSERRGRDKNLDLIVAALDAPMSKPPPPSPEEAERRYGVGRSYVIGKFNRHNEINHDLTCKIKLKQHAINMLPRNSKLKEAALEISNDGPPKWRHIPTDTPPIPNFDPSAFFEDE